MTQLIQAVPEIVQNDLLAFNLKERENELENKIKDLAAKVGISDPKNLIIEYKHSFDLNADAKGVNYEKYYVSVSPLYVMKYEDFPEKWRGIKCPSGGLALRVAEELEEMNTKLRPEQPPIPTEVETAVALLHLLSDKDQFEKAKNFVVAHELSHIKHYEMKKAASEVISVFKIIQIIIDLGRLLISTFIFTPFSFHESDQTSLILRHVLIDDRAYTYLEDKKKLKEKYADLDAAAVLKTAEGGLHLFNALQEGNKCIRNIQLSLHGNAAYDEQGNTLNNKTHPSHTERKAYLTDWQNRKNLYRVS